MRRVVSVPALVLLGVGFVMLLPIWLPVALVIDLLTAPRRMPRTRLLAFGLWWSWLEIAGVAVCAWLFVTGRAHRVPQHYSLQRWWANGLVVGLRTTCRLHLEPRRFRLAERNPARAAKLRGLQHLNPPRPAGTLAVLDAAAAADIVFVAHAGFEGLDTFGGILRSIPGTAPVLVECDRVSRADVPDGDEASTAWLDDLWLRMDGRVDDLVRERATLGAAVAR
jgi:hypothetical protein